MTDIDTMLAEVKRLDAEATPSAWDEWTLERGTFPPRYNALGPNTYSQDAADADAALIAYYRTAAPALAAEVERLRGEVERYRDALNRDKTGLAAALVEVRKVAAGYRWIGEGEWGSYEWQDRTVGTLQKETGNALDKIECIAERSLSASGVLATNAIRGDAAKGAER